jgi:FkbM family methyltransferase
MHKLGILGREETQVLPSTAAPRNDNARYRRKPGNLHSPARQVFAFEPQPFPYQQLVSNVQANKVSNVVCNNLAASSSSDQLSLQSGTVNWGDDRILAAATTAPGHITVDAISLDEQFADRKIDFLKIDVQGWKAEALFGARHLLEGNMDLIVMFELWPYGLLKAGSPPEMLLRFLWTFGIWDFNSGASGKDASKI